MVETRRYPAPRTHSEPAAPPRWGFLTNHAVVLVYVVMHPETTVRAVATDIGITERATLGILRDLNIEGIVDRRRDGRRTTYSVNFGRLSSVRRGGASMPLTPRPFVETVVKMLYDLYPRTVAAHGEVQAPQHVPPDELQARQGSWGFFTNHMLVLLSLARGGEQTVRELAAAVRVTERAAISILNSLEDERIIHRRREGRRNSYRIDVQAFRRFRGWRLRAWAIPPKLVDVAAQSIEALAQR